MRVEQMERRVNILEGRVDRIEQILPTLATKDDLQAAMEPLATKAELSEARVELQATIGRAEQRMRAHTDAVADGLRDELGQTEQRMRTHFDVVTESLRDDIKLVATAFESLARRNH